MHKRRGRRFSEGWGVTWDARPNNKPPVESAYSALWRRLEARQPARTMSIVSGSILVRSRPPAFPPIFFGFDIPCLTHVPVVLIKNQLILIEHRSFKIHKITREPNIQKDQFPRVYTTALQGTTPPSPLAFESIAKIPGKLSAYTTRAAPRELTTTSHSFCSFFRPLSRRSPARCKRFRGAPPRGALSKHYSSDYFYAALALTS